VQPRQPDELALLRLRVEDPPVLPVEVREHPRGRLAVVQPQRAVEDPAAQLLDEVLQQPRGLA